MNWHILSQNPQYLSMGHMWLEKRGSALFLIVYDGSGNRELELV